MNIDYWLPQTRCTQLKLPTQRESYDDPPPTHLCLWTLQYPWTYIYRTMAARDKLHTHSESFITLDTIGSIHHLHICVFGPFSTVDHSSTGQWSTQKQYVQLASPVRFCNMKFLKMFLKLDFSLYRPVEKVAFFLQPF